MLKLLKSVEIIIKKTTKIIKGDGKCLENTIALLKCFQNVSTSSNKI